MSTMTTHGNNSLQHGHNLLPIVMMIAPAAAATAAIILILTVLISTLQGLLRQPQRRQTHFIPQKGSAPPRKNTFTMLALPVNTAQCKLVFPSGIAWLGSAPACNNSSATWILPGKMAQLKAVEPIKLVLCKSGEYARSNSTISTLEYLQAYMMGVTLYAFSWLTSAPCWRRWRTMGRLLLRQA